MIPKKQSKQNPRLWNLRRFCQWKGWIDNNQEMVYVQHLDRYADPS